MTTTPTNHRPDIHDTDWLTPYLVDSSAGTTSGPYRAEATSLVDISGRKVRSLDGRWRFSLDQFDNCLRGRWFEERLTDATGSEIPVDYSFDEWGLVTVPACWNLQEPEWLWYEGSGVYVRDFTAEDGTGRTFVHFEGANHSAFVFLNGSYVGWHSGGSTPFSLEVTGRLRGENRLVVVVDNTRRPDRVPAENIDWFNYGGLYRGVSLVCVPATFIRSASFALRPDGMFSTLDVSVTVSGDVTTPRTAVLEIPELGVREEVAISGVTTRVSLTARPELWSPESPRLYEVRVVLDDDTWSDKVGFREIRVDADQILLNGRPLYLKGVCLHEDSPENGRSLTRAEVENDMAIAKDLGCNYLRLSHYPHSRTAARVADELGMLLWEEIPVYWSIDFTSPVARRDAENQLAELIARDVNRASVIIWSVGNETPDTDDRLDCMTRLVNRARAADPTRLVSAACLTDLSVPVIADRLVELVDVVGVNEYYGWYERDLDQLPLLFANSQVGKPVVVCEFGADAVAGLHGASNHLLTEEFQLAVYTNQLAVFPTVGYLRGISPWVLCDFRSPRRTHAQQGYYNLKGLVDATKTQRKLAFAAVQDFYARTPSYPEAVGARG